MCRDLDARLQANAIISQPGRLWLRRTVRGRVLTGRALLAHALLAESHPQARPIEVVHPLQGVYVL